MENPLGKINLGHERSAVKKEAFDLKNIRNWEDVENGKICIKKIEAEPTPVWKNGWYQNPTSGRSLNYGLDTDKPEKHFTVVLKGGAFYVDQKCKEFMVKNDVFLDELYGGITYDCAQKEFNIANLIQEKFKESLNKKANCPEPIDFQEISKIKDDQNKIFTLTEFFKEARKKEGKESAFTLSNIVRTASALGIDMMYPMSEDASKEAKKDPFGWLFNECLEKSKQSVYRYKIEGPNTRILDLMTIGLPERQKYFCEANNAKDLSDAIGRFSAKMGEFYGLLHKNEISYHGSSSEHCTLADITISGTIMDIGGLSEASEEENEKIDSIKNEIENLFIIKMEKIEKKSHSESYISQMTGIANLIAYLCKNVLKVDNTILDNSLNTFWDKYKSLYSDENVEFFSERKNIDKEPQKIRTKYFNRTTGDWIKLASDLENLSHDGENK